MSEYRPLLEKAGDRAKPAPDAFEKLERRRARKQRNKRIATTVFAFAIAIGGSVGAFTAFRGSNGNGATQIGGSTSDHFYALWPWWTATDAQRAQDLADSGGSSLGWLTDAGATADRFASQVLGWQQTMMTPISASDANGSGPLQVTVSTLPPPCPSPPPGSAGPFNCGPDQATLTLQRLVRQDPTGVWSVTAVGSAFPSPENALALPFAPGETVVSGQEVSIPFSVPLGEQVQAAYTYIGACGLSGSFVNVQVDPDRISFEVGGSSFEESCSPNGANGSGSSSIGGGSGPGGADLNVAIDGYVVVLVANGLDPSSGWDPITAGAPLPQGASIVALAAVPVHFVPAHPEISPSPTGAAVPDVAQVSCDVTTTEVLTPEVATQPDGVHISVTNTSSSDLSLQFKDVGGDNAPVGTNEVVWPIAPGPLELRCADPNADAGRPGGYAQLAVVDPQGFYVPFDLQCGNGGAVSGFSDYVQGAVGEQGDPVDITKKNATGLLPTDTVESAGYPRASERIVRVVRDGSVVANFRYFSDGHGGWLQVSYNACTAAGIG